MQMGVDDPVERPGAQGVRNQRPSHRSMFYIARINQRGAIRIHQQDAIRGQPVALKEVHAAGQSEAFMKGPHPKNP
jgi:hypothetical protein